MGAGGLFLLPTLLLYFLAPFISLFCLPKGQKLLYFAIIIIMPVLAGFIGSLAQQYGYPQTPTGSLIRVPAMILSMGLILGPHLIFIFHLNDTYRVRSYYIGIFYISFALIELSTGLFTELLRLLQINSYNYRTWIMAIHYLIVSILLINIHYGLRRSKKYQSEQEHYLTI